MRNLFLAAALAVGLSTAACNPAPQLQNVPEAVEYEEDDDDDDGHKKKKSSYSSNKSKR